MGTSSPPALAPTENQLKLLAELVLDDSTAIDTVLPDQGSALYRALEFLVSTIDNNKNDFVDKEILIERYVLAVLYFSTDGDGWNANANNGWLSVLSVCEWAWLHR